MSANTTAIGSCCVSVLRTREPERAAAFYAALAGWSTQTINPGRGHKFFLAEERIVAALQHVESDSTGWVPHFLADSLDGLSWSAEAAGGTLVDRANLPGVARLATLSDAEGALFGLWQPTSHRGAEQMHTVGSLWWVEVLSNDVPLARTFYGRLFGWTSGITPIGPFDRYVTFKRGEVQEGGLLPIDPEWDVSPAWNSIFHVHDCDEAMNRACVLGGASIFVHTVPRAGRIGLIQDPEGHTFVMRSPVPAD